MMRVAIAAVVVLATLLGLFVLWQVARVVVLFLLSLALTAAVRPFVDRLAASGLPRLVGLTGAYLVGLGVLALLVFIVGGFLVNDLSHAGADFIRLAEHVATTWPREGWLQQAIARRVPPPGEVAAALTGPQGTALLQATLGTAFSIVGAAIDLIVVFVLSIYWMIDRVHFERLWLSLVPVDARAVGRDIWRALEREVRAYFRSAGVQSFLGGLLLGLGYWAMGFPYPALMAVLAALAWFIPWVGIVFAVLAFGALSLPLVLLEGRLVVPVVAGIYTIVVLALLEVVVEPRWFDRRRYNSLLMALALVAMAENFGVLGLILGPPLAIAVQLLGEHLLRSRLATKTKEEVPSLESLQERLARLRAQADALKEPPPELATMIERLGTLIGEARDVRPEPSANVGAGDRMGELSRGDSPCLPG